MATYTPPPYFPQGSLAPADNKRYLKFRLAMAALALIVLGVLIGAGIGIWYLVKSIV